MRQQKYWVGFNTSRGIGPSRLRSILSYFNHDLEAAWHAASDELANAGLEERTLHEFLKHRQTINLDAIIEKVQRSEATIITLDDEAYPRLLAEIHDAPPLLYVKGQLLPKDGNCLAVIGTRRATNYGHTVTRQISEVLARSGMTIVSGLARGLDASAHRAALEAGGRTIAVMANGIDIVYPAENRKLTETIVQRGQGALITEYPPGTPPDSRHFPARNRIISGLSLGVLVVEAPQKSGTLLTADFAAEQGREIFAVPGNITAPNSQGTNRLIQDGAKMVLRPEDILDELRLTYRKAETRQAVQKIVPESPFELEILRAIALEPLHVDEIAIRTQQSIHEVSAALAILELRGAIQQAAPMTYQLSPDIDPDSLTL